MKYLKEFRMFENILDEKYGCTTGSLHTKINEIEWFFTTKEVNFLRKVATVRNKIIHGEDAEIPSNIKDFLVSLYSDNDSADKLPLDISSFSNPEFLIEERIIDLSNHLENWLVQMGAIKGKGLHSTALSIKNQIPDQEMRVIEEIAKERNKIVHVGIDDSKVFEAFNLLKGIISNVNDLSKKLEFENSIQIPVKYNRKFLKANLVFNSKAKYINDKAKTHKSARSELDNSQFSYTPSKEGVYKAKKESINCEMLNSQSSPIPSISSQPKEKVNKSKKKSVVLRILVIVVFIIIIFVFFNQQILDITKMLLCKLGSLILYTIEQFLIAILNAVTGIIKAILNLIVSIILDILKGIAYGIIILFKSLASFVYESILYIANLVIDILIYFITLPFHIIMSFFK